MASSRPSLDGRALFGLILIATMVLITVGPARSILRTGLHGLQGHGGTGTTQGSVANFSGSKNEEIAYRYLASQGLKPMQAAAIVGNLIQESNVNPTSRNGHSGAFGIVQWLSGRLTGTEAPHLGLNGFAAQHHLNRDELTTQLQFLWWEATANNSAERQDWHALDHLKAASTIEDAVHIWATQYERPGKAETNLPRRIQNAHDVLNQYG